MDDDSMTAMGMRVVILALAVGGAWWAVRMVERRGGVRKPPATGLARLTLITATTCRLCEAAERALRQHGATPMTIDVGADHGFGRVRSLPVAVVTSEDGTVLMRRAGRSVIEDAPALASLTSVRG
jgi:hypothetical protein